VVVNSTTITAKVTVPASSALGAYTVTVTNADGSKGSCSTCFSVVAAPTVTGISPPSAARGSSTSVTITGNGFVAGATVKGPSKVTFTNIVVVNSTTITATMTISAKAAVGTNLPITVTNSSAGGYGKATGDVLTIT
jgi:hypothetical protein